MPSGSWAQLAWRCVRGAWAAEGALDSYRVQPTGLVADWFSVMCYDPYGTPWRRETARGAVAAKAVAESWENEAGDRRSDGRWRRRGGSAETRENES